MNKFTLLAAVAALSATPAFADFNADIHATYGGAAAGGGTTGGHVGYGVGVGYDHNVSKNIFIGGQLGLDENVIIPGLGSQRSISAVARVGANLGAKNKLYVLGGYVNQQIFGPLNVDGWRLGAGVEHGFGKKFFAKLEYRHSQGKLFGATASQNEGVLGFGVHF